MRTCGLRPPALQPASRDSVRPAGRAAGGTAVRTSTHEPLPTSQLTMTARVDSCLASRRSSQNASSLVFLFRPATVGCSTYMLHVSGNAGVAGCQKWTHRSRPRSQRCSAGAPFAHQRTWLHTCTPLPHTHSTAGSSGCRHPCKSRCRRRRRHRRLSWATSFCRRDQRCTQYKWQGRSAVNGTQHRDWLLSLGHPMLPTASRPCSFTPPLVQPAHS